MAMSLSKRQKQILRLMRDHDCPTIFSGGSRSFGWRLVEGDNPLLVIRAYMSPEYFLARRGLIQPHANNARFQYVLTKRGRGVTAWLPKYEDIK